MTTETIEKTEETMSKKESIKERVITPSSTPLKSYPDLICPKCEEGDVLIQADNPDVVLCQNCENEEIDLELITNIVEGWMEYLRDREAYLSQVEKEI